MIFITLGTQKFQFNRILMEIDELCKNKIITEPLFAQIGYSDYVPRFFEFEKFMDHQKFSEMINKSSIVITHGGTGAIITALKKNKTVIAIPRLKKFGEHVDDHQLQIVQMFSDLDFIEPCFQVQELRKILTNVPNKEYKKFESNNKMFLKNLENDIGEIL